MQATLEQTNRNQLIEETKADFIRNKDGILKNLATTPDDRINWSPSPTARTPLQVVAHSALALGGFHGMLMGAAFPWENIAQADAEWRESEKKYTTRQEVIDLLEENSANYLAWLDTLTTEQLGQPFHTPFGEVPYSVAITFMGNHLFGHASQIQYIQTVYGDLDWHLG